MKKILGIAFVSAVLAGGAFAQSISLLQQLQFLKLPTSEWLTPLISITSYHYNADFCCHTGV